MPVAGARVLLPRRGLALQQHTRLPRVVRVGVAVASNGGGSSRNFQTSLPASRGPSTDDSPAAPAEEKKDDNTVNKEAEQQTSTPPSTEEQKNNNASAAAAAVENNTNDAQQQQQQPPQPTPPPEPKKDKLPPRTAIPPNSSPSVGRVRVSASGTIFRRPEEVPSLRLPPWFVNNNVSLYESRPIGSLETLLFPLSEEDREKVLELLDSQLEKASITDLDVQAWIDRLNESSISPQVLEKLVRRFKAVHNAAFLQALAIVHTPYADPKDLEVLRLHHAELEEHIMRLSWWADEELSGEAQRWLANVRVDDTGFDGRAGGMGAVHASPLANRVDPEYSVCVELLAALRTQLLASPPPVAGSGGRSDSRRPVTVLTIMNRKGSSVANSVVDDVATDMKADVVHLDSHSLARLLGGYFGQNVYWGRGSLGMLGYMAAEMNGRMASRVGGGGVGEDGETEIGMTVVLPSRLRSFLSPKEGVNGASSEGRWEELKATNALNAFVASAEVKRSVSGVGAEQPRDLIIHLHDYIEISSLKPVLINKLRMIVDRMWQTGRKVVLVGSTSADITRSYPLREQVQEIMREGSHILPFHSSQPENTEWMEKTDNLFQNIDNIKDMLQAMLGPEIEITFHEQIRAETAVNPLSGGGGGGGGGKYDTLIETLSSTLYDVQWVYRLVSLIVGSRIPRFQKFTLGHLRYALDFLSDRNKHLTKAFPNIRPPYFSPLFGSRSRMNFSFSNSGGGDEDGGGSPANLPSSAQGKEFDQYEKKLLSGLINAEDIHTTFNDIIVPKETKESLIGLTSLSLIRPDAFSYGVLKTERIPGCLLYGPPGTGKTLLAKAVAKESGANMLEVSAASINDMWLGQSEKNVRALFSLARKLTPCVIFLDEADALLGARQNTPGRTGHRETITQFLREWDGLSDMRAFIMVATNRPFDLDEAVLRRLPRKILVDLPLTAEREKILGVMLRDETLADDVLLGQLATETELYSGSDLKNLCVSAAMEAVREEVRVKEAFEAENNSSSPEEGGGKEYVFPERRVLTRKHFEKGLKEISASISEDMDSLKAIRKFDEQYGDSGRKNKKGGKRGGIGFEVVVTKGGTEEARVRQVLP
ncbi:hypothetical protein QBC38DRAFT_549704 [Podospora fimiseda]|uniref:AAA+ ATPase domain-containing protein n=1 Tax=Podospora fimiseda TaxID=252190 RepID=A0AAN6YPM7_9PEZI|nr:hypothetical protein QBC38DRAFT_549704 [Podospora fimiseda]